MNNLGDIDNCDREPVRTIGFIQPHGIFYACKPNNLKITHASANGGNAVEKPVESVLESDVAIAVKSFVESTRNKWNVKTTVNGVQRIAILHRVKADCVAIELENISGDNPALSTVDVQRTIDQIKTAKDSGALLQLLTRAVRELTGYDRVMGYTFDEEWNGNVAVDERHEDMPSWLNFRYPSNDIPAPARELFTKNWSRIIPNVEFAPVAILPETDPESPAALDLTYSTLRAPSPIHVEYLKNMKVGGSFTLSLLCNGRLWGMIACHHRTPFFVNFASREAAELLAMAASAQLSTWETRDKQDATQRMRLVKEWLQAAVENGDDPTDVLVEKSNLLIELTNSNGVALIKPDEIIRLGDCPDESQIRTIIDRVKESCEPVFAVRSISQVMPSASCATNKCAGIMVVKVARRAEDEYIIWFRREMVEEVTWGGDPRKNVKQSDGRIHPRKSFAAWKETVRHTSTPWTLPVQRFAEQLSEAITEAERTTPR